MGALEQIHKAFGKKKSLYDILGVAKDASQATIRKAYFKLALTCHPDKCPDDAEATAKFQALSLVHVTLSTEEKRKVYDRTGEIEERDEEETKSEKEWYDYWRNLFPTITKKDIERFQGEYQGGEEEKEEVLKAYIEHEGQMDAVIDNVMLATDEDEDRFRELIEDAIKAKKVKRFKAFKASVKNDAARKKMAAKEAKEAEKLLREIQKKRGPTALATLAADRQRQTTSFLDSLEAKYAPPGPSGGKEKKRKDPVPLDDADFEQCQKRLTRGRKK